MNIGSWLLIIIGGIFGIGLVGGMVVGIIAVIIYKIYRACRYHISIFD